MTTVFHSGLTGSRTNQPNGFQYNRGFPHKKPWVRAQHPQGYALVSAQGPMGFRTIVSL